MSANRAAGGSVRLIVISVVAVSGRAIEKSQQRLLTASQAC